MARALALLLLAVAVLLPSTAAADPTQTVPEQLPIASQNSTEQGNIPSVGPLRGVIAAAAALKGGNPDPRPASAGYVDHGVLPEIATPHPTFAHAWVAPVSDDTVAPGHAALPRQRGPPEAPRFALA